MIRGGKRVFLMTTEEASVDTVRALPPDQQREVLHFAEFLQQKAIGNSGATYDTLFGFWSGGDVSAEEIAQARQEMWGNFPREAP
jgi:hypothetical protein